jgi:hypothetical protein
MIKRFEVIRSGKSKTTLADVDRFIAQHKNEPDLIVEIDRAGIGDCFADRLEDAGFMVRSGDPACTFNGHLSPRDSQAFALLEQDVEFALASKGRTDESKTDIREAHANVRCLLANKSRDSCPRHGITRVTHPPREDDGLGVFCNGRGIYAVEQEMLALYLIYRTGKSLRETVEDSDRRTFSPVGHFSGQASRNRGRIIDRLWCLLDRHDLFWEDADAAVRGAMLPMVCQRRGCNYRTVPMRYPEVGTGLGKIPDCPNIPPPPRPDPASLPPPWRQA